MPSTNNPLGRVLLSQARKAIADAITVVGKAEYIRFYEKTGTGAYKAIVIDWSKL